MSMLRVAPLAAVLLALSACGSDTDPRAEPVPTMTVTTTGTVTTTESVEATETVTVTVTVEPTPTEAADPFAGQFPKGFPKKVAVSDIPSPIDSAYEGFDFAVQLAPGVYTSLPPGATLEDAAFGDIADGYCASIDAFIRKFRNGEEMGGSCW